MKTKKTILFSFLCSLILASCGHNSIDEPSVQVNKIPIDSFYITFKINGEVIEMKSTPTSTGYASGMSTDRLFKLKNSSQDSVIIGFTYEYFDDNYSIKIGISKCCLLDTIAIQNLSIPLSVKKEIMETTNYQLRFMPPIASVRSTINKYTGFYMVIYNKKNGSYYTTYLDDFSEYNNDVEYTKVSTNSEFKIIKSTELNSGIYADYLNTWFIESSFKCRIYRRGTNAFIMEEVTDGELKGCF